MYSYVRRDIIFKLPKLIKDISKSFEVSVDEQTINGIMNQIIYYTTNHCHAFNVARNGILVDIKSVNNDICKKYGYNLAEEFTLHIKLYSKNTIKKYTMRELVFLLNTGKLLAIYHYKPIMKDGCTWNKIYTVHTDVIEKIREHANE